VGPSGCGKSTLFNILQGFYIPTEGQVLLEGIDVNEYDLHHLRGSFGVVSQEPMLFNESIAWNMRYNLTSISDKDLSWAARAANYYPKI
jgi:ATP-binding cassette, subfamily B (MDR/TAP), member 1